MFAVVCPDTVSIQNAQASFHTFDSQLQVVPKEDVEKAEAVRSACQRVPSTELAATIKKTL